MEYIQQEINSHKIKLMNLINNLLNTQLINQEIFINNELKKEIECLTSLLNVKQNTLMNQNNINNNINLNPLVLQPNQFINNPPMNMNQIQIEPQQIKMNDFYNFENDNNINNQPKNPNTLINLCFIRVGRND